MTVIEEMRPHHRAGVKFKYNMSKWEFAAKDQGEGQWLKNY